MHYDSYISIIDPKKTAKYHKKKDTPHNVLSPNRSSNLDFYYDVTIIETTSHNKHPVSSYSNENTGKLQNSINMTSANKKSNIRPSISTTMHSSWKPTLFKCDPTSEKKRNSV